MLGSTRNIRVFAYTQPADLRKSYDGLHGIVAQNMCREILAGDLFLFVNRRRNRAKVLMWDGTGLCIYMKRLEKGRFAKLWGKMESRGLELTASELALFLEGCQLVGKTRLSPQDQTAQQFAGRVQE